MLKSEPAFQPGSHCFRAFVHLAVLLLLLMSGAQATHHHGSWTVGAVAHASSSGHGMEAKETGESELTCPLCLATHVLRPGVAASIVRLDFRWQRVLTALRTTQLRSIWSYSLFGRPPPLF